MQWKQGTMCSWSSKLECCTFVQCMYVIVEWPVLSADCTCVCKLHCTLRALRPGGCPVGGSQWVLPTPLISLLPRLLHNQCQFYFIFDLSSHIFPLRTGTLTSRVAKTCRPCRPVGANFSWPVLTFGQSMRKTMPLCPTLISLIYV